MADIDFTVPCWYRQGCKRLCENPDCRKTCQIYMQMNYLIMNCGMPDTDRYLKLLCPQKIDLETFKKLAHLKENIVRFVENGFDCYISSENVQNGKTTWSLKLLYKYFSEIWLGNGFNPRGYFLYVPEFLNKLRSKEYRESFEFKEIDHLLKTVDLVVWDDITTMTLSEWDQNTLLNYLNKRSMLGKSNIYNGARPTSLESAVGKLIAMKIERAVPFVIKGTSRVSWE